jgi:uncharacterized protein YyaL (SSP411 family)
VWVPTLLLGVASLVSCDRPADRASAPEPVAPPGAVTAAAPPAETTQTTPETHASDAHGGGATNRLGRETSPYLLQHARNPVDWYAWGPEAFEAARRLDKPIFLSVGYSTCYWCHVMERESFENEEIAAVMNEHFVCIKVDREERPDVDDIYMAAVQTLAGRGGWPMSVFLEPGSLRPFEGGTYFGPTPSGGRPSFPQLLESVRQRWSSERAQVLRKAEQVSATVRRRLSLQTQPQPVDGRQLERVVTLMMSRYDPEHGGFRRSRPKFPVPVEMEMLVAVAWDDQSVRNAITHTLDRMATGGMYDQVGGGFHRYSTDRRWLVPHFEKMLYDNAQLASLYSKVHGRTGDGFYARIVRETLDYVLREMTDPSGAFYSAQDSEVNAREGASYVWLGAEAQEILTNAGLEEDVPFALAVLGLNRGGNFRDPHHPEDAPKNVLFMAARPDQLATSLRMTTTAFDERIDRVKEAMLTARSLREQPLTDDKVLAGWNGLMITGMVDGAQALDEPRYLDAARRAARFVVETMRRDDGGLLRTSRGGRARIDAFANDYALMIEGLLRLHAATEESWCRNAAVELAAAARARFWDDARGGYYDTLADQDDLFVRTRTTRDSVIPCANSVMLINLLDLHEVTGDGAYLDDAVATLDSVSSLLARSPTNVTLSVVGLARFVRDHPQRLPGATAVAAAPREAVEVTVEPRTLDLTIAESAQGEVVLRIGPGYHVNAHDPGLPELIGIDLRLVGTGLELEVDYPEGAPFQVQAFPRPIRVHSDEVRLPFTIRRTGEAAGRARCVLRYQVCTDEMCLRPATVVLPLVVVAQSS